MKIVDKGVMQTAAATASSLASELSNTAHEAGRLGNAAAKLAGQTVRENPWRTVGLAAGVAFLLGLLMRRN
jgi:ElaB/YqjD/DUF883 family membrane-anchored ribosome-binding protein